MDRAKIEGFRARMFSYREFRSTITTTELIAFARDVGRVQDNSGNWMSTHLMESPPIAIPSVPAELNRYIIGDILRRIEEDIDDIEDLLNSLEEIDNAQIN